MEVDFYFGEHLRWNLGWGNPNQAGAFIAMLIPWLWGVGYWLQLRDRKLWAWLVLVVELMLWFLVCKTFSRGALLSGVAGGIAFWFWRSRSDGAWRLKRWHVGRLLSIVGLLLATDFFARIDPRFVTQDASAGNRLVLWKGGLQMIAVAPWQGWGVGQSGFCFSQWFQPLEAKERYLGMVNSYLHVGVEWGLPVLAVGMSGLFGLVVTALSAGRQSRGLAADLLMAGGASLMVWLAANVFSTLWIFPHLWWAPGVAGLGVIGGGFVAMGRLFMKVWWRGGLVGVGCSVLIVGGLFTAGHFMPPIARVSQSADAVKIGTGNSANRRIIFIPETSVLGADWGKEIRRLAVTEPFHYAEILVPRGTVPLVWDEPTQPSEIIACGSNWRAGIAMNSQFPEATVTLVHPVGRPEFPDIFNGKVMLILPMLDTKNSGRPWRAAAVEHKWQCVLISGVGQDIRTAWPDALLNRK